MQTTHTLNGHSAPASIISDRAPGADLSERAMLVSLTLRQWRGTATDKRAGKKVAEDAGARAAAQEVGRYRKNLFGSKGPLARVVKASGAARTLHYFLTLPWLDSGQRILPARLFERYAEEMSRVERLWREATQEFLSDYERHREEARARLGTLYAEDDYPTLQGARSKFSFDLRYMPLPSASDFRAELTGAQVARIQAQIRASVEAGIEAATREAWDRLYAACERAAERLDLYQIGEGGKVRNPFRDSLVENITELCQVLPALNVSGSADMDRLAREMRERLTAYAPQTLREDARARKQVASAAREIMGAMSAFMGGQV